MPQNIVLFSAKLVKANLYPLIEITIENFCKCFSQDLYLYDDDLFYACTGFVCLLFESLRYLI